MEPRKFASRGAANFLQRFPLSDLDGSGMRSATPWMPLAGDVSWHQRSMSAGSCRNASSMILVLMA